ncbi:MAG: hypothetical protein DVB23_001488 [Verrucomicrobia bacterium]|jgi:hypothetical protein|nr:MAG: hypothetical protein DVB23_001488 [Verrucomicrobiota bacterium]
MKRNVFVGLLVCWLTWVPFAEARERVFRGQWDGKAIEIRLKINDRSGAVTGQVYRPSDSSNVLASLNGKVLPDGTMELKLTYRFEDYGTYRLQLADDGTTRIWQTERRDLWFGQSD